jgi:plasmid stabilization system protein ParE
MTMLPVVLSTFAQEDIFGIATYLAAQSHDVGVGVRFYI